MNSRGKPEWPDLAGRARSAQVLYANAEMSPSGRTPDQAEEAGFRPHTFRPQGTDPWKRETRRRRDPAGT